ncbi:hypothetical protein PTI45_04024 [Paenibacillus nuruki]|uniref:DUF5704 domain-containing protein n=1 Tax=Paenibacillus nuruki TaxID=1886670 RepID=A0A1E3KYK8_9BACL|nr:DUF5704 domain-containing protein [Paenibacillus nuruki]ODP26619.1 hypothetical protein PTI45_04024 [Paenibacillus nuruki]
MAFILFKYRAFVSVILLIIFLIPTLVFPANNSFAAESNSAVTPVSFYKNKEANATDANYRYFVGMMYFDMWKGTTWDLGKEPQKGMYGEAMQDYIFKFPNRKIKSITAEQFEPTTQNLVYFDASRTDSWKHYEYIVSNGGKDNTTSFTSSGIGTDTASIPFKIKMKLDTDSGLTEDITKNCGSRCNDGVKGYRIYAPVLFTIELDSELNVYYKTKDGKSLNDVFPPRVEEMKPGTEYDLTHPENEKYKYIGYKKSTTGEDPTGEILTGDPPKFKYTGSFETYIAYQYYDLATTDPCELDPDAEECTVPPEPPKEESLCEYTILPPSVKTTTNKSLLDPQAQGHILADDNTNDRHFDATRAIPTSENLYANAWGYNYLFQHAFDNMDGQVEYKCKVKVVYKLKWKEKRGSGDNERWVSKSDTDTKTYNFSYTRDYDYWKIKVLEVLGLDKATMSNYALPGGKVSIPTTGYTPPSLKQEHSDKVEDHVKPDGDVPVKYSPPTLDGGKQGRPRVPNDESKLKRIAEGNTDDAEVRNDTIQFSFKGKDTMVMNGDWKTKVAPVPSAIPDPTKIRSYKDSAEKVLYKGSQLISSKLVNKANTASSGTIYYAMLKENVEGSGDKNFPITGINSVTVHTPVTDYSSVSDDKVHNQKTTPSNRMALILDRPFTVRIPTSGAHLNGSSYPGYGSRDYAKYFKTKQVLFPFDVYSKDSKNFYPKNTWIDVPVAQLDTVFNLPVWIDEGNYTVYFRNIAENAPTSFTAQQDANTDLVNHVASDTVDVEIIGRIYDFHVTDIADFNWETVFRKAKGSSQPTGNSFWVGTKGIDGDPRGNHSPYVLPIMRGSHPLSNYKNVAVKTGYHFKFDLKTKGNMFGDKDAIRITPTFVYEDKSASTSPKRVEVDLYYHTDDKKFIKIGSSSDTERRTVILNNRLRNVPSDDIKNTASSIYDLSQNWSLTKEEYITSYKKRANQSTYTGGYDIQLLSSPLRTFINTFSRPESASASPARVNASVQQWYGEYSLPAQVYAVPKGTDLAKYGRSNTLDEKSDVFLKKGFIVVNFDIESIVEANVDAPHLQYIHSPLNNQWWDMEGYDGTDGERDRIVTDPYNVKYSVKDGDVIFYDTDLSSYDDFASKGTH